jgi:hypothetical protein
LKPGNRWSICPEIFIEHDQSWWNCENADLALHEWLTDLILEFRLTRQKVKVTLSKSGTTGLYTAMIILRSIMAIEAIKVSFRLTAGHDHAGRISNWGRCVSLLWMKRKTWIFLYQIEHRNDSLDCPCCSSLFSLRKSFNPHLWLPVVILGTIIEIAILLFRFSVIIILPQRSLPKRCFDCPGQSRVTAKASPCQGIISNIYRSRYK